MRSLVIFVMVAASGCGINATSATGEVVPDVAVCTLDGQPADDCYAASKGGGAMFGLALTRGMLGFYFQASTQSRAASTFPSPNNDMDYTATSAAFPAGYTYTGTGSATWTDDGVTFCVTATAVCELSTPTTHIACVPSSKLN